MSDWDVDFARGDHEGRPLLVVTGEIDLAVAARFEQELTRLVDDASGAECVVDLSSVAFIDSSGVRELLKAKRAADGAGGDLALRDPSDPCRRVLEISGVWNDFSIRRAQ
jgi:anti-sigma B factor antagonist